MLLNVILILGILFISLRIENSYKVPLPLPVLLLTILVSSIYPNFMGFTNLEVFSEEMLAFIVILVLCDAFVLKWKEIKENWFSLLYLAVIAVVLSVISGLVITKTIFYEYGLSTGAIIVLFSMCLATDPVAVVSTFNQYKLPHKLKFLAEGESLFNDAAALIMFSVFGLAMLKGIEVNTGYIFTEVLTVIIGSIINGFIFGLIGIYFLKITKDTMGELVLILLIAYISFFVAEHFHTLNGNTLSGLLSEIVSIITITTIIYASLNREEIRNENRKNIILNSKIKIIGKAKEKSDKFINNWISDITNAERQKDIAVFLNVLALFVNAVLFISLAKIIKFENLLFYWKEILTMFLITTLIRALMMGKFALISNKKKNMTNINFRWWLILLFAGIKGGLSIVMLHILNKTIPHFEHKVMFESIIMGIILLSVFVYVIGLMITIFINKEKFKIDCEEEKH